jgi:hypothetical protein
VTTLLSASNPATHYPPIRDLVSISAGLLPSWTPGRRFFRADRWRPPPATAFAVGREGRSYRTRLLRKFGIIPVSRNNFYGLLPPALVRGHCSKALPSLGRTSWVPISLSMSGESSGPRPIHGPILPVVGRFVRSATCSHLRSLIRILSTAGSFTHRWK